MSSSSEDDFYGNTAQKLHELKKNWNPGIKIDTVDSDCPSDSDKSPIVVDSPSPKITKNKKLTKRVPAKKISATDSTGSTESDISRACVNFTRAHVTADDADQAAEAPAAGMGAPGALPRSRRSRGNTRRTPATRGTRRSRGRHRFSNVQAVVNLGCWTDEEDSSQPLFAKPQPKTNSNEIDDVDLDTSVNCSDKESDNDEISVKVHWRSKEYHKFPIRKHQKVKPIFEFFSNLENVPMDHLLLTLGDRVLRPQDTPADFNYNVCQFIEGGVVSQSVAKIAEESAKQYGAGGKRKDTTGSKLHIKLQSIDTKVGKPFKIWMGVDQKFSYAMMRFSEEYEVPLDKLRLYFDGELVDVESTPRKLDFEGDECIDVKVLS